MGRQVGQRDRPGQQFERPALAVLDVRGGREREAGALGGEGAHELEVFERHLGGRNFNRMGGAKEASDNQGVQDLFHKIWLTGMCRNKTNWQRLGTAAAP